MRSVLVAPLVHAGLLIGFLTIGAKRGEQTPSALQDQVSGMTQKVRQLVAAGFDPAVVQPASTPYDQAGTLSNTMSITPNAANPGHLIISAFRSGALSGSGTLLKLRFNVVGSAGTYFRAFHFGRELVRRGHVVEIPLQRPTRQYR